jgi:hypothetical protein
MSGSKELAKISLEISPDQLKRIINLGKMEEFVNQAVEIFKLDLKTELVKESVSSVKTALFLEDDDEYGTGPRPPHWWNLKKMEALEARISLLEQVNTINVLR